MAELALYLAVAGSVFTTLVGRAKKRTKYRLRESSCFPDLWYVVKYSEGVERAASGPPLPFEQAQKLRTAYEQGVKKYD